MSMILSPVRAAKALYSLANLVRDPTRLGEVFEMIDALTTPKVMKPMIEELSKDPAAARSFEERHRIRIDLPKLRKLPEGTLGRAYATHMDAQNLDPAALPNEPSHDPVSFFRAHLYETHDIWHAAFGFGVDLAGELGLQGVYLAQIPGPLPGLLIAVGFLRRSFYDRSLTEPLMENLIRGWRMGKGARVLFGVHWDEYWELPLEEVRARLGIGRDIQDADARHPSDDGVPLAGDERRSRPNDLAAADHRVAS